MRTLLSTILLVSILGGCKSVNTVEYIDVFLFVQNGKKESTQVTISAGSEILFDQFVTPVDIMPPVFSAFNVRLVQPLSTVTAVIKGTVYSQPIDSDTKTIGVSVGDTVQPLMVYDCLVGLK